MLDDNFYQFIYDTEKTYEQCMEDRQKFKKEREKLLIARFGGTPEQEKKKLRE